jgi:hypothetical protein
MPFAIVGGVATVVAVVAAILLLAVGGSAGNNVKNTAVTREQAIALLAANGTTTVSPAAPGLFAFVNAGGLTTIVPAGWRATAQAASGATRAEFADPKDQHSNLTIVAQASRAANPHAQAASALKAVKSKGDAVSSYGPTAFPGGREAWHVTYADALGVTHQTLFYAACGSKVAMVVDIAATSAKFIQTQKTLEAIAATAEPTC